MSENNPTISIWYDDKTGWNVKFHAPMRIQSAVLYLDALQAEEVGALVRGYCLLDDIIANRQRKKKE